MVNNPDSHDGRYFPKNRRVPKFDDAKGMPVASCLGGPVANMRWKHHCRLPKRLTCEIESR